MMLKPATQISDLDTGESTGIASKTDAAPHQKLQENLAGATPAMQQYFALKHQHPDCLLFYRMGDFYELFFDDARIASSILDIALTKRGKHGDEEIAMCGVPVHSHESYLERLIASGRKVAICEQMESPEEAKKRGGYKAIVTRDVVRVVTPGTITEERLLDARSSSFLAAIGQHKGQTALAWVELSTGSFQLLSCPEAQLKTELDRLQPREVLLPDAIASNPELLELSAALSPLPPASFDPKKGREQLRQTYQLAVLDSLGEFSEAEYAACAALLDYLRLTQKGVMPRLERPQRLTAQEWMGIDGATRRNLELLETLNGSRKGSLLHAIDRTVTAAGGRLLAQRLSTPLTLPEPINRRLDQVGFFLETPLLRQDLRSALRHCPDMERALSRLCLLRGGPRDLLAVVQALDTTLHIRTLFERLDPANQPFASQLTTHLSDHAPLREELKCALKIDPPLLARDGNFIASGYHAALDEFRMLRDESKQLIAALQQNYQQETGITTLKIKFNNVLGYFVEITPTHESKITETFIHRQSLQGALRYTTKELAELAHKLSEAADRAVKLELEIFDTLVEMIRAAADSLAITARALAGLDAASALAELAVTEDYCRPLVDSSLTFAIEQGRHPVVEQHLKAERQPFMANDCVLVTSSELRVTSNELRTKRGQEAAVSSEIQWRSEATTSDQVGAQPARRQEPEALSANNNPSLWLLTGPNMAGKSTFLRQNALIAILAQIGSYVPAKSAHIGVVDRVFSRVGAADDLARGRSTFMVEMVETATILTQATDRSIVILDEIGRGTATYDGLSIAWAVVEHLYHHNRCRALFATHYHELTQLAQQLPGLTCHHMRVKEWKGDVIFLHSVGEGAADRSYGIHVAKLAGLPAPVIARARQLLQMLERSPNALNPQALAQELPLFAAAMSEIPKIARHNEPPEAPHPALEKLEALNPDTLTPREALDLLYEIKSLTKSS